MLYNMRVEGFILWNYYKNVPSNWLEAVERGRAIEIRVFCITI